ncbi:MAG: SDR family NAD(P)-dependent oxidoreductase [Pseudomonadota bacterium]
MRDFNGQTYWLVGASEGLGRAVAFELSKLGAHLIISARNAERLDALAAELPGPVKAVACDIADSDSVAAAAAEVGDVDGMVFLAGVYWPMKAGEWDTDKALSMAEVNFNGAIRVLGAVVPAMVARKSGHIVITGSLSGFRGLPGSIGYSASKAGVMSLAECLQADLRGTGVDVQLINPGFIRTRLTDKNDFTMPFIIDPEPAAKIFVNFMGGSRFQRNFPTVFSWVFRLGRLLPDAIYYPVFAPQPKG